MSDGVVQQVGTPMDLYDNPANLFVANFLGTANILDGDVGAGAFRISGGGSVPMAADAEAPTGAKVVFRPQNAVLGLPAGTAADGLTRLHGRIIHFEFLGASVRYGVRIGTNDVLVDVPHRAGVRPFQAGDAVAVDIDHARAIFLVA